MNTAERNRCWSIALSGMNRAARLGLQATSRLLEWAARAIGMSWRAIDRARPLLAGTSGTYPSGISGPGPVPQDIVINSPALCVSLPALDSADKELQRAELEYGRAFLGLSRVWTKLETSLTDDLAREEAAAKAIYDRAVAVLREREARWFALQEALAVEQEAVRLGPPPRTRLN